VIGGIPHTLSTQGWWIVSRSSGIVAFVLVTISVFLGLTMAGKPFREPGFARTLKALHEQTALAALIAIGVHGTGILLDPWLKPGVTGVSIPFVLSLHRFWVGIGIIAGYLAVLLGLSFYFRKQIGPRLWRQAHRATVLVYVLGLFHALGSGTDTGSLPFFAWAVGSGVPIALLFVYRLGASRRASERRRAATRSRNREAGRGAYEQAAYDTV
jgi:methionine sulfoxide reductase heme-binding subunit